MNGINRRDMLALAAAASLSSGVAKSEPGADEVTAQTGSFTAARLPKLAMTIDPSLEYVGSFKFPIQRVAVGYRYLWGEVGPAKRLKRVFIVHREGFYERAGGRYDEPAGDRVTLGGEAYGHGVVLYDNDPAAAKAKQDVAYQTQQLFTEKGLRWEAETIMSRFARVVDDAAQNEIAFFYFENLADNSEVDLQQLRARGSVDPEVARLKAAVGDRSLKAFQIKA